MSLKTFLRVYGKAELRVIILLIVTALFFILSMIAHIFLLLLCIDLWANLLLLTLAILLISLLITLSYENPSKIPSKQDKSWISWLQLEWLYQNYFRSNYITSLLFFILTSFRLLEQGYSLWNSLIQIITSTLLLPFSLSLIFKIPKRDKFDEFQINQSRVGRACFAYLAEKMSNLNKINEAVQYMKYVLEMMSDQYSEGGFEVKSVQETMSLLEILSSRDFSCVGKYSDKLRELASVLANFNTVDEYVPRFKSLLSDLKWFEDVKSIPSTPRLLLYWKIIRSGVIGGIVTTFLWIFQDEVKSLVSKFIVPMLTSYGFLFLILPILISLLLFLHLERLAPKYRIELSDLEILVEYLDKK